MLHGQFARGHPGVKGGRVEHATAPFCRYCGECRAEIGGGFRRRKKCSAGNSAQTARSTLCSVGGTEVGACLLNVIVSRHCIQSRACGDKSALVTKLAMQSAGVSAWSAETKKPTVVRRPGMHKEMCSLLAGMKRSQRTTLSREIQSWLAMVAALGPEGGPRDVTREAQTWRTWALRCCTGPVYRRQRAGGCLRANRENAQTTGQKTSRVARKAEASR
jgi:hypothetical protein